MLNKDFYHLSAGTIEVKSNTPNGVAFKVNGKSSHDKVTSGAVRLRVPNIELGGRADGVLVALSGAADHRARSRSRENTVTSHWVRRNAQQIPLPPINPK